MKKSLIAMAAMLAISGSAFATSPSLGSANVTANSVSTTYATAGNGGTSVSRAGNFSMGLGSTDSNRNFSMLSVTVPECDVKTTAVLFGHITTVSGEVATVGGSYANNVSTGNGTGGALAYGNAVADVSKTVVVNETVYSLWGTKLGTGTGEVSGTAFSATSTWAGAGTNTATSSIASQEASFEAKGGVGVVGLFEGKKLVVSGLGALTSGVSTVPASSQIVNGPANACAKCDASNPGAPFADAVAAYATATGSAAGSSTLGNATTLSNVTFTNVKK